MKSIELTEEHKSKLLEMCNKLFPKYKFEFGYSETTNSCKNLFKFETQEYLTICEPEEPYDNLIHWFEFCVNHLTIKLNVSREDLMNFGCNTIEYLYEEFKKLK